MFSNAEQYTSASKAFFESQLDALSALANIAVHGTEKIVALNIAAVKASANDSAVVVKDLMAAKDQQAALSMATEFAKPNADKIAAYSRQLTEIVSATQAEMTKVADQQAAAIQGKVSDLVDVIGKNAPAGSENVVAMLKSSVANGKEGYEKMTSAAKQAVDATHAQVAKTTDKMTEAAKKVTGK